MVGEGFDGGGVDDSLAFAEGLGDGVFGHGSFTGGGVGCDEDGFVAGDVFGGLGLEGVEFEGVCFGRWEMGVVYFGSVTAGDCGE